MSKSAEDMQNILGSIFGDLGYDEDSIRVRCSNGDRAAMRLALDKCEAEISPVPDWLWASLSAACRKAT